MLCLLEADLVHEIHSLCLEAALKNARSLLPEIQDYVDVVWLDPDDWGNQNALMAPPRVFRDLFLPYRKRHNEEIHRIAPHIKTFLHSCGALYEILDMLVETGIRAILNYAPIALSVPEHVHVQHIDPAAHMQHMTFYLE